MKLKHLLSALLLSLSVLPLSAQSDSLALQDIRHFQDELNQEYQTPGKSPLPPAARATFQEHDFYPVNLEYRLQGRFIRTGHAPPFRMVTTTDRRPLYRKYGEVHFALQGKPYVLNVYQSLDLAQKAEYRDYLFIPFTDLTNGHETYGGGRYIDLRIPAGDTLLLDFNKAYNPYCAYAPGYSCPVPPAENRLPISIPAGIKFAQKEK